MEMRSVGIKVPKLRADHAVTGIDNSASPPKVQEQISPIMPEFLRYGLFEFALIKDDEPVPIPITSDTMPIELQSTFLDYLITRKKKEGEEIISIDQNDIVQGFNECNDKEGVINSFLGKFDLVNLLLKAATIHNKDPKNKGQVVALVMGSPFGVPHNAYQNMVGIDQVKKKYYLVRYGIDMSNDGSSDKARADKLADLPGTQAQSGLKMPDDLRLGLVEFAGQKCREASITNEHILHEFLQARAVIQDLDDQQGLSDDLHSGDGDSYASSSTDVDMDAQNTRSVPEYLKLIDFTRSHRQVTEIMSYETDRILADFAESEGGKGGMWYNMDHYCLVERARNHECARIEANSSPMPVHLLEAFFNYLSTSKLNSKEAGRIDFVRRTDMIQAIKDCEDKEGIISKFLIKAESRYLSQLWIQLEAIARKPSSDKVLTSVWDRR